MPLPRLPDDGRKKIQQVYFAGYNHVEGSPDGTIYDMQNLTGDKYPIITPRDKRITYTDNTSGRPNTLTSPRGIVGVDYLAWVAGTTFWYNCVSKGTVAASTKTFAVINNWICIFPDNKYYDTSQTYKYTSSAGGLTFGTATIVSATADFDDFSPGTELNITGCTTQTGNNKRATIVSISDDAKTMNFAASTFTAASPEAGTVVLDPFFPMEQTYTVTNKIKFSDGEYGGEYAMANSIVTSDTPFYGYSVGDALQITGATATNNNTPYIYPIIREISTDKKTLRFYENAFDLANADTFESVVLSEKADDSATVAFYCGGVGVTPTLAAGSYSLAQNTSIAMSTAGAAELVNKCYINKAASSSTQTGTTYFKATAATWDSGTSIMTIEADEYNVLQYSADTAAITIKRAVPTLNFPIEHNNRIWGIDTSDNTIRCSKLGNPLVWDDFEGLSDGCWQTTVGSAGSFTGGISYKQPVFAKEQWFYEIYGTKPSNFQFISSARTGVLSGASKSMAVVRETLLYQSRDGIMAYNGGIPRKISAPLGDTEYSAGVAGADGNKYYISLYDGAAYTLFCYNVETDMWHKEDATQVIGFWYTTDLYAMTAAGAIVALNPLNATGSTEATAAWYAEFGDFTDSSPNKKSSSKWHIRMYIGTGITVTVAVSYDGGAYETVATKTAGSKQSYYLPVLPHRADHYRLKISGTNNDVKIYSIARERYIGSEY